MEQPPYGVNLKRQIEERRVFEESTRRISKSPEQQFP